LIALAALLVISPASLAVGALMQAVAAAPTTESNRRQLLKVATPVRNPAVATAPPQGAQPTEAIQFDTSLRWKSDPSTRTVFSIDGNRRIWFIDPTSGWPYTLDSRGVVYTANALSGIVYSLGSLARWQGTIPYFFRYWSVVGGMVTMPTLGLFMAIAANPNFGAFSYSECYSEIWEYGNDFESAEFSAANLNLQIDADADRVDDGNENVDVQDTNTVDTGSGQETDGDGGTNFGGGADAGGGGDLGGGE